MTDISDLQQSIEEIFEVKPASYSDPERQLFADFKALLNSGAIRAAAPEPSEPTGWRVNAWVKKGILLGFRMGGIIDMTNGGALPFFDKETYPLKTFDAAAGCVLCPAAPAFGTAATWGGASLACRPCTSTWAATWATAR